MTDASRRFAGRHILITGGARGQGAAHAERLGAEGATVYIGDVLDDTGQKHAERLRANGLAVQYVHLDVAGPGSWAEVRRTIEAQTPVLDGLVNNAGVIHVTPLEDESLEAWNRLLAINLTGTLLGLQTMAPLLRRSTAPSVVNVSSVFGVSGAVGYAAYTASKAGVLGLTRTAALEFAGDGIRVNALVPGGVSTPMNEQEPDGGVVPETPLGRRADVTELAAAVCYLLSADASFVTGAELVVDGGFLTR